MPYNIYYTAVYLIIIYILIKYLYKDQQETLKVPLDAQANGTCGDKQAQLILQWTEMENNKSKRSIPANVNEKANIIIMTFENNGKRSHLDSIEVKVYLDKHNFVDAMGKI